MSLYVESATWQFPYAKNNNGAHLSISNWGDIYNQRLLGRGHGLDTVGDKHDPVQTNAFKKALSTGIQKHLYSIEI